MMDCRLPVMRRRNCFSRKKSKVRHNIHSRRFPHLIHPTAEKPTSPRHRLCRSGVRTPLSKRYNPIWPQKSRSNHPFKSRCPSLQHQSIRSVAVTLSMGITVQLHEPNKSAKPQCTVLQSHPSPAIRSGGRRLLRKRFNRTWLQKSGNSRLFKSRCPSPRRPSIRITAVTLFMRITEQRHALGRNAKPQANILRSNLSPVIRNRDEKAISKRNKRSWRKSGIRPSPPKEPTA